MTVGTITETELADALQELAARTGNGNSYFPDLARNVFEYVTSRRRLPTGDQVRAWLRSNHWTLIGDGSAGTLWSPPFPGHSVGVLHSDREVSTIGAIERIADRLDRPAAEVRAEMLAVDEATAHSQGEQA